ncbi:type II protein arginine methyltransferase [Rhizobium leguminosarum]|uniref:methyltransferase domain-containing protein n=1 Tax=Rhizobium leguminosarum TaxID=384 RepID=UPI00161E6EAA|nr:methyltransferase domain-containing protein [Rhizobium leguminosarum]MBB5666459.1 type II protein arginine methyltransferase [Rhizobium leguminosarum]
MREFPASVKHFVDEIEGTPDFARRLAAMAAKLACVLNKNDLLSLVLHARAIATGDAFVWRLTEPIVRRIIPEWHWAIASDDWRNSIYDGAIRASVTPESVVLEIGTGTGLLAMMAARAGAAHVYTCEVEPELASIARSIIARNGYEDRITVINADASSLTIGGLLPRPCNVLLHEIVSNDLLGENVLELVAHAKSSLLERDAILLPENIWVMGQLIGDDWPVRLIRLSDHAGFDLSLVNLMAPATGSISGPSIINHPLSEPFRLLSFDLRQETRYPPRSREIQVPVTANGIASTVIQWIGFSFPSGTVFENAPATRSCWAHRLHPLIPEKEVKVGGTLGLQCAYDADLLTISVTS